LNELLIDKSIIKQVKHSTIKKKVKVARNKRLITKTIIQKSLQVILVSTLAFPLFPAGCSNKSTTLYLAYDERTRNKGFINSSGKWAIQPQHMYALPFSEGYALVVIGKGSEAEDVFINQKGKVAIKPEGIPVGGFSNGLALALSRDSETYLYGYLNTKGKWAIEPQYTAAIGFSNGYAIISFDGFTWMTIDQSGKTIAQIPGANMLAYPVTKDGTFAMAGYDSITRTFDLRGNLIHEASYYNEHAQFNEGLAAVKDKRNGLVGFIDKNSDWVIAAQFSKAYGFSEGYSAAQDPESGKWGYIDLKGNWVIQPCFENCSSFENALAFAQSETTGTWGVINKSGEWVVSPFTEMIHPHELANYTIKEMGLHNSIATDILTWYGPYLGVFNGDLALIVVPDGDHSLEYRYIDKKGRTVYSWVFKYK